MNIILITIKKKSPVTNAQELVHFYEVYSEEGVLLGIYSLTFCKTH